MSARCGGNSNPGSAPAPMVFPAGSKFYSGKDVLEFASENMRPKKPALRSVLEDASKKPFLLSGLKDAELHFVNIDGEIYLDSGGLEHAILSYVDLATAAQFHASTCFHFKHESHEEKFLRAAGRLSETSSLPEFTDLLCDAVCMYFGIETSYFSREPRENTVLDSPPPSPDPPGYIVFLDFLIGQKIANFSSQTPNFHRQPPQVTVNLKISRATPHRHRHRRQHLTSGSPPKMEISRTLLTSLFSVSLRWPSTSSAR